MFRTQTRSLDSFIFLNTCVFKSIFILPPMCNNVLIFYLFSEKESQMQKIKTIINNPINKKIRIPNWKTLSPIREFKILAEIIYPFYI